MRRRFLGRTQYPSEGPCGRRHTPPKKVFQARTDVIRLRSPIFFFSLALIHINHGEVHRQTLDINSKTPFIIRRRKIISNVGVIGSEQTGINQYGQSEPKDRSGLLIMAENLSIAVLDLSFAEMMPPFEKGIAPESADHQLTVQSGNGLKQYSFKNLDPNRLISIFFCMI